MSTPFRLQVPRSIVAEMLVHARAELPNECCGLLAGSVAEGATARAEQCYPLVNAAASPRHYLSDPRSMLRADKDMRRRGLSLLAVYHSHPLSAPVPSPTDLAQNNYGAEVVNFIISLMAAEPDIRGWWLAETDYSEAEWEQTD